MNASSKKCAADALSHTKTAFDDEGMTTLPKPSEAGSITSFSEGSVMWDGPSSLGEGARSAGPAHQGTKTSFSAEAVTNSPTAVREVNLGSVSASPDAQHKSAEITDAQQMTSSSKPSLCDAVSANEPVFDLEENSAALQQHILAQIDATPIAVRPLMETLHELVQKQKAEMAASPQLVRKPASLSSMLSTQEVDEWVTEGWQLLDSLKVNRIHRKDTQPSAQTITAYQKDCRFLDRVRLHISEETRWRWYEVLMLFVQRKSTFYTYRAALSWRAALALEGLLKAHDSLQINIGTNASLALLPKIKEAVRELVSLRKLTYEFCSGQVDLEPKSKRSRKEDLEHLDDYWPTRFIEECVTSSTYRNACVLLRFCGMRPEELKQGVRVVRRKDVVEVEIRGAKVTPKSGQPWRRFALRAGDLPDWFVNGLAPDAITAVQAHPDNFRSYLNGLTSRVLNGAKRPDGSAICLSAYLFRHQLATDLRSKKWTSTEIAKVLGEITADTVKQYGLRWPGSKRPQFTVALQKASLQTARPVRAASRAGIEKAQASKKSKAQSSYRKSQ